ncbi:class I adenylate-forming enzyme family protein [Mycolicibacterium thermoresistibile]|nr:class I adenylate-forming enzyme family protein [Mycolicibacterium thermoresistibile]MCV7188598.1 acyl--CoA ligase [Mycolicibacterium thermoresistibile]SNW17609.1 AMP-dependent synthetase and ligase [Mycolicibacterium thermoresistibile]
MTGEPVTIPALLRRRIADRVDHPLLICPGGRLSYGEAEKRSAQLARGLIALGAGKGTHVGVLYPNGPDFIIAMLAAARIGAVVVPFTTFGTAPELRDQLRHSDTEILLATGRYRSHDYRARLGEVLSGADLSGRVFHPDVPNLRHVLIDRAPADTTDDTLLRALQDDVDGADPLTIVYTSGSTSAPKGVVHTHTALIEHQRNLNAIRRFTAADRLFCNSPFFWIGGIAFSVLATMVAGATLVCSDAEDPAVTLDLLESVRPTLTNGYVAGIAALAAHPSLPHRDLSSMRRGNLYPIMAPDARPPDPALRHQMLGMTETGSVVLLDGDDADQPEHRRGSFGRPAPGYATRVVDPDTGDPVPPGQPGELWVRGPYLMQRYYRHSREECFDPDGWFHTGDLVRIDTDGYHYFLGRRGAMIKTAGANVAPAEVEQAISRITGGPAHVLGLPDAERGQVVAAVVVVDDVAGFDPDELRHRLRDRLSSYKIPRRIVARTRTEIPVRSSGKIDQTELMKVFDA